MEYTMDIISVNGTMITDKDIERALIRYIVQLEEDESPYEPTEASLKFLRIEASNALISRVLLLDRAKRKGCVVSEEEVLKEIENIHSRFESKDNWDKNLMLFQLSEEDVHNEVKNDLLIERLIDLEASEEEITDELVTSFYEMNAQFIRDPTLYTFYEISAASKEKLEQIVQCLKTKEEVFEIENYVKEIGETFFHHVDVTEGSIPEAVREILGDLSSQQIGTMLLPEGGYVVYKLLARREGKQYPLTSVKNDLKRYLEHERRVKTYQRILDEEMEKADIRYLQADYFEKY